MADINDWYEAVEDVLPKREEVCCETCRHSGTCERECFLKRYEPWEDEEK